MKILMWVARLSLFTFCVATGFFGAYTLWILLLEFYSSIWQAFFLHGDD